MPINKISVFGWYGSMHEETQGPEGAIGWPEESASTGLLEHGVGRRRQSKVQRHSAYNQAGGTEINLVENQPSN
jgi:hypothetical protein